MPLHSIDASADAMRFQGFATRNGDAVAIIDPDGTAWSRRQIADRANRLARALRSHGMGAGSVMALVAPNGAHFLVAYLAATQIGMYVVPINWHLATSEIRYILTDSGATTLVSHVRFRMAMESVVQGDPSCCGRRIGLGGNMPGFTSFDEFTSGFEGIAIPDPIHGRVLTYTSATTGRPKGVLLPLDEAERALDLAISARINAGTLPEEHVQLCASMLYHGAPLEGVIVGLHLGHMIVLMDLPEPESILAAIDRYKVTMAYIVPTAFSRLLSLREEIRNKYSTATLRKVLHAGTACPIGVKHRMIEWWGPIFWEAYGATEGAGTVASTQDWLRFPGTVGRPMPGTRLKIVAPEGDEELPSGSVGLIYFTRYSGERFEYLNDPEKTRAAYRGEFFTVGDLGYLNSEGFLFLQDRVVDVINIGGTKIYPAEIEGIICGHPQIEDCAVIGTQDARYGETALAIVCTKDPHIDFPVFRRELVRWLSSRVSLFKIPAQFVLAREIPRDPSGKVRKRALRERYASTLGDL